MKEKLMIIAILICQLISVVTNIILYNTTKFGAFAYLAGFMSVLFIQSVILAMGILSIEKDIKNKEWW